MVVHIWTVEPTTTGRRHSGAVTGSAERERVIRANRRAGRWADYFYDPVTPSRKLPGFGNSKLAIHARRQPLLAALLEEEQMRQGCGCECFLTTAAPRFMRTRTLQGKDVLKSSSVTVLAYRPAVVEALLPYLRFLLLWFWTLMQARETSSGK